MRLGLLALLLFSAVNVAAVEDPSAFIRTLYDRDQKDLPDPVYDAKSREEIARTFDDALAGLIWRDLVEADGEVGRMDGHYLYGYSDNEVTEIRVTTLSQENRRARVRATMKYPAGPNAVEFELTRSGESWRIANIVYQEGSDYLTVMSGSLPTKIDSEDTAKALCASRAEYQLPSQLLAAKYEVTREPGDERAFCQDALYGLGGEARDPLRTLRCCLELGTCNREIAVIFANGWGVERDFDAAIHFLCKAENEMAASELWAMLDHVQQLRRGDTTEDLDFCNFAVSSEGTFECALRRESEWRPRFEQRLIAVASASAGAPKKFAALRAAAERFIEADATWTTERYRQGTIYNTIGVSSRVEGQETFIDLLEKLSRERAASSTSSESKRADADLNAAYKARLAAIARCDPEFASCPEDEPSEEENLRAAQRAWIAYRDAWIAYYLARWRGAAPADALRREVATLLTSLRIEELRAEK